MNSIFGHAFCRIILIIPTACLRELQSGRLIVEFSGQIKLYVFLFAEIKVLEHAICCRSASLVVAIFELDSVVV